MQSLVSRDADLVHSDTRSISSSMNSNVESIESGEATNLVDFLASLPQTHTMPKVRNVCPGKRNTTDDPPYTTRSGTRGMRRTERKIYKCKTKFSTVRNRTITPESRRYTKTIARSVARQGLPAKKTRGGKRPGAGRPRKKEKAAQMQVSQEYHSVTQTTKSIEQPGIAELTFDAPDIPEPAENEGSADELARATSLGASHLLGLRKQRQVLRSHGVPTGRKQTGSTEGFKKEVYLARQLLARSERTMEEAKTDREAAERLLKFLGWGENKGPEELQAADSSLQTGSVEQCRKDAYLARQLLARSERKMEEAKVDREAAEILLKFIGWDEKEGHEELHTSKSPLQRSSDTQKGMAVQGKRISG